MSDASIRAGLPATIDLAEKVRVTTEFIPITELWPIVTPLSTAAPVPIQTLSSIDTGWSGFKIWLAMLNMGWVSLAQISTPSDIMQSDPITTEFF